MKIVLVLTTTLISLLAIGAISNNENRIVLAAGEAVGKAFAQIDPEDVQTTESMDGSETTTTTTNTATTDTMGMTNQSETMMKMNWTGTIDVHATIGEAFKSKITVNIIDAITTAQNSVGANSFVKAAELTEAHNYLIYKVTVVGEDMKKYKVGVDPGTGEVLFKKEMTWYDEHKEKYGKDKGDKYGKDYN